MFHLVCCCMNQGCYTKLCSEFIITIQNYHSLLFTVKSTQPSCSHSCPAGSYLLVWLPMAADRGETLIAYYTYHLLWTNDIYRELSGVKMYDYFLSLLLFLKSFRDVCHSLRDICPSLTVVYNYPRSVHNFSRYVFHSLLNICCRHTFTQ